MITPVYEDKVKVLNKITLWPKTEKEYTYLLERHEGAKGRSKDAAIIAFISKNAADIRNDAEFISRISTDPDFDKIALLALDLDDKPEVADKLTYAELIRAFMQAMDFRQGEMEQPEVQEALKK